jgi:hypothetical protein
MWHAQEEQPKPAPFTTTAPLEAECKRLQQEMLAQVPPFTDMLWTYFRCVSVAVAVGVGVVVVVVVAFLCMHFSALILEYVGMF